MPTKIVSTRILWVRVFSIGREALEGKSNRAGRENCRSSDIYEGKNWHQIRISRSGERQKICRIVAMKIRGNILCSEELGGLCCQWNAYNQNLNRIDEMKNLPGAWIWKTFHYSIIRSEATWDLLFMSRYCSRKRLGTVFKCSEV